MPAFQHSIDLGYMYLETDVHLSADGVLYAFHDSNLRRGTGLDANIADLESHKIDSLLVDGLASIPRFDEIMTTWPQARVNIDTKSDASVLPLIHALRAHDALDRVCVGSFSDRRVRLCRRELGPDLCTSMGQREALRLWLATRGLADPSLMQAQCAQVPRKRFVAFAEPRLISFAHECGIQVHVWTVDEPDDIRLMLEYEVDGIMTDQPRVLREVLMAQGAWPHQTRVRQDQVGQTERAQTEGAQTEGAQTEGAQTEGAQTEGALL